MKLQKLMAAYRLQNKISIRKLAREIGVDHAALFRFEKGQRAMSNELAKLLVWVLSV